MIFHGNFLSIQIKRKKKENIISYIFSTYKRDLRLAVAVCIDCRIKANLNNPEYFAMTFQMW